MNRKQIGLERGEFHGTFLLSIAEYLVSWNLKDLFISYSRAAKIAPPPVITIMQHVLHTLSTENPSISKAFFRQDNTGCYHSSATLLACPSIEASTGIKVVGVDFSDPQGGKGAADRMAAAAKSHIRMYINEGHDVTNAEQMKAALLSYGGVEGVRVATVDRLDEHVVSDTQQKITAISKLNNFRFTNGKIVARRAYGIGSGKEIAMNPSTMAGMLLK